jgi:hypothetical protein
MQAARRPMRDPAVLQQYRNAKEHHGRSEAFERKGNFRLTRLTRQARRYQNLLTETACTGITLGRPHRSQAPAGRYSRLMDVDEVATLQAHPCEVLDPAIVVLKSWRD